MIHGKDWSKGEIDLKTLKEITPFLSYGPGSTIPLFATRSDKKEYSRVRCWLCNKESTNWKIYHTGNSHYMIQCEKCHEITKYDLPLIGISCANTVWGPHEGKFLWDCPTVINSQNPLNP